MKETEDYIYIERETANKADGVTDRAISNDRQTKIDCEIHREGERE